MSTARTWNQARAIVTELDGSALFDRALAGNVHPETRQGGSFPLPRGEQRITRPLIIEGVDGLAVEGVNERATTIRYVGPPDPVGAAVIVRNCRAVELSRLTVTSDVPLKDLVRFESTPERRHNVTVTKNALKQVVLNGQDRTANGHTIHSPDDQNNEFNIFERVEVLHTTYSAFTIGHAQSKTNVYTRCAMKYGRFGLIAARGSFSWRDGSASSLSGGDFYIGQPYEPCSIDVHNTEGGVGLLESSGPSSADAPISCRGIRWNVDYERLAASAAAWLLCYRQSGPLSVTDSTFIVNAPAAVVLDPAKLRIIHYAYGAAKLKIDNVNFIWRDSASMAGGLVKSNTGYPFTVTRSGNQFRDAAGKMAHVEGW